MTKLIFDAIAAWLIVNNYEVTKYWKSAKVIEFNKKSQRWKVYEPWEDTKLKMVLLNIESSECKEFETFKEFRDLLKKLK